MTRRRFAPLAALLLAALLFAGCGGGGGGEPTVTQALYDELQAELDAALAAKRQAEAAKTTADEARATADAARMAADEARTAAEGERDTARAAEMAAEAAKMEAEAAQAEAEADEAEALAAQMAAEAQLATALKDKAAVEADRDAKRDEATAAQVELIEVKAARDAAQAQVTRLTGELETANTSVTRLTGELSTANDKVDDLTGRIGNSTDTADAAATASLHAQLNAAKAEANRLTGELTTAQDRVTELETRVGTADDAQSLQGMLAAEKVKVGTLTMERDTARGEVTRIQGLLDTANRRVTELETLVGDAVNPASTSLRGQLAAARAEAATLRGQLTGLRAELDEAEGDIAEAERRAREAETDANQRIKQAEQQTNVALRAEKLIPVLDLTSEAVDREEDVTVKYTRKDGREFEPIDIYPVSGAAPSISGWHSSSFTRDRSDTTDTIYLYTNIDAPSTRAFWKDYGPSVAMTEDLQAMATGSSAGNNGDTDAGTDGRQYTELTVSGTFRGASGKFTCDSCGGTIATGSTSGIASHVTFERGKPPTFIAPTSWTFEPTRITNGVRLDQDDTYLYFGIWLQEPKNAADAPNFKWIAGGGDETGDALANFGDLTGTATFTGGAVGKYAVKTGVNREASVGTFTAKAELRAQFGDTDTISGGITEFREGGQSLAGWNIYLEGPTNGRAELDAAGTTGSPTTAGRIGGVPVTGSWAALLFGNDNVTTGLTIGDLTCQRSGCVADLAGVAGWFEANDNGTDAADASVAIAGAFGAEYKP